MLQSNSSHAHGQATASIRVFTLGRFLLQVNGDTVRFGPKAPRKPLELLKVLVALGGDAVPVEHLCESLWPDADGDRAHSSLASNLSRLRKIIGADAILLQDGRISLDPAHCWVDAREFSTQLSTASQFINESTSDNVWSSIETPMELYRGPFLDGEFEPSEILSARERLHSLFLRHIGKFGQYFCEIDQENRAVELLQKGLEVDDLAEEFYQGLMRCYLNQGRIAEGIALYQRCRQIFSASVGIEPSQATEELHGELMAARNAPNPEEAPPSALSPPEGNLQDLQPDSSAVAPVPQVESQVPPAAKGHVPETGERRLATVAIFNFYGYWAMTEALDTEEAEGFMDRVRADATRIVEAHEGIINQFVAEEIHAVFGIPSAHESDSSGAVMAALELRECVRAINTEIEKRVGNPFQMHAGISTGIVVAHAGDHREGRYGIAGDAVNIAAGLLRQAKADEILIGPEANRLVEGYFETKPLKPLNQKWRAQPVAAFQVIADAHVSTRFEVSAARGLTPYTGREEELRILQRCLHKAVAGEGQFVTVIGDAGMGKSRLFHEFRERLDMGDRVRLIHGWALRGQKNTPYHPYLSAIRPGLGIHPDQSPAQRHETAVTNIRAIHPVLEKHIPALLHLISIPSDQFSLPPELKGQALQDTLNEALGAAVSLSARLRPLIILMENWHWADEASDKWLRKFLGVLASHPILLVVNYRPEIEPDWGNYSHHTTVHLGPVDSQGTEAIVRASLGAETLSAGLAATIHDRTGGNPFFIEELCSLLLEEQAVTVEQGMASPGRKSDLNRYPDTVQAVVRSRLDRLGPVTRNVLHAASVIGRQFMLSILEAITDSRETLLQVLDDLLRIELIQQIQVAPDPEYCFKHVITREVAYDTLLLRERRLLHRKVGETIEQKHAEQLEEQYETLARHYELGGVPEKAVRYLELAGDKAVGLFALEEARLHYRRAIDLLDPGEPSPEQKIRYIEISLKWGDASYYVANLAHVAVFKTCRRFAEELGEQSRLAPLTYWIGRLSAAAGMARDAAEEYKHALDLAERYGDEQMVIRSNNAIGRVCFHSGEYARGIEVLEKAMPRLLEIGEDSEWVFSASILGRIHGMMGDFPQCFSWMEQALDKAREIGDLTRESACLADISMSKALQGDWDAAIDFSDRAMAPAERLGNTLIAAIACCAKGLAVLMSQDRKAGVALMGQAIALRKSPGYVDLAFINGFACEAIALAGESTATREAVREMKQLILQTGARTGEIPYLRAQALLSAQGRTPNWKKAFAFMEKALKLAEERGARPHAAICLYRHAELLGQQGDKTKARRLLKNSRDLFAEIGMSWWEAQARSLRSGLSRKT